MRDYASYFSDRQTPEKRGVSVNRDIDWWMEYLAGRMGKLLFVVLLMVMFIVVKAFYQVSKSQQVFPIEHVALTGNVQITRQQHIAEALGQLGQTSLFDVNIRQLSNALQNLPWIASATVARQWPDTLVIDVVEYQASYRWGENYLLDKQGNRFISSHHPKFEQLPLLEGVDGYESEMIAAYEQLVQALGDKKEDLGIKKLVLTPYLSWQLHLEEGMMLKFGRDNYQQHMMLFVKTYHQNDLPDFERMWSVDFRYRSGFSVKWKPAFLPPNAKGNEQMINASHTQI